MARLDQPTTKGPLGILARAMLASAMCVGAFTSASAGEADATKLLKAMSDYMASQLSLIHI